jgi:very-short-patch-repair endonuclease
LSEWARGARLPAHEPTGPFVRIAAAAAHQFGLALTSQLIEAGLSKSAISRWVQLGRLERITPGIYRLCHVPETWHQRVLAATLAGPPGTVASHRSAAALHGFRGFPPGIVEVACSRWRRARLPGVLVHESLVVPAAHATVRDGIHVTNPTRTIIDLGAVAHPFKVGRALDEARRRGDVDLRGVSQLFTQLAARGRNGIATIRLLLDERQGTALASTGFEQLLLELVDAFGLPRPATQVRVSRGNFTAFVDFAYRDARVAIEMDSEEYHLDLEQFHYDRTRQNQLVLLGWRVLRFTERHLRHERLRVAREIASALALDVLPPDSSR